ncbi:WhiB family transcriptional regulator [Nonomuraea sp. GTA35]|uniref:WhiB family transcriptional regulator n=1 Tax=Nonomuraea sp. GTA35 TaxID=1676746 RepID=UPI0035C12D63
MADWTDRAACRDEDPRLFFPADGEREGQRKWREVKAKRVCAPCPVQGDCLEYALARNEREGVWGGLNPDQRAREADRRAALPPPPKPALVVEKTCTRCGVVQPVAAFTKDAKQRDGLNPWCRGCTAEASRRRRAAEQAVA